MAGELLTIVYKHNHECLRRGQEYVYRPVCKNGVAEIPELVCIESNAKLQIFDVRKT